MIGNFLKDRRMKLSVTQKEICAGLCDRSLLSHIETNKIVPSLTLLKDLCKRLDLNLADAIQQIGDDDMEQEDTDRVINYLEELLAAEDYEGVVLRGKEFWEQKFIQSNPLTKARVFHVIGAALHRSYRFGESHEFFQKANEVYSTSAYTTDDYIISLNALGASLRETGQTAESYRILRSCERLINESTNEKLQIKVFYNISCVLIDLCEYEKSIHYARDALSIVKRSGIYEYGGHLESNIGIVAWSSGSRQEAIQHFIKALRFYQFIGDEPSIFGVQQNIKAVQVGEFVPR